MQPRKDTKREDAEEGTALSSPKLPLLGLGLAVLFASATFFSGLQLGSGMGLEASVGSLLSPQTQPADNADLSEFWQVWNLLNEKFVASTTTEPVSAQDRVYGAIEGLVASYGDPYTIFLPPSDAEAFEEDISGNFSGVGMEVGVRDGYITVIAPLPDTPADKAGILTGDIVTRIDGVSTEGMSVDEAVDRIRGEKGTTVTLTIYRQGEDQMREVPVVRDTINVPTIETKTDGDVFIISIYSFNALAEAEMQRALRDYVASGKTKLILDLRGNPGGYLQGAVSIGSYFLPTGKVIVRESFGDGKAEQVYRSTGKTLGIHAPKQMVVLVNGGSASASEILAGALQEQGVATLIGSQTYGKGSVQELVDLFDGSSLKVTVARWLTPNGRSISAGGLTPDMVVDRTNEQILSGDDPQMQKAMEFLDQ
jgi:carboxyl-terminal processing protease